MREIRSKYREVQIREIKKSERLLDNKDDLSWPVIDSPLLEKKEYDAPAIGFNFEGVLPGKYDDIKDYTERTLASKRGRATLIELGGTGSSLAAGFSRGFFEKSAGVNLTDYRDDIDPRLKATDALRNHDVIAGDILSSDTQEHVRSWLGEGRKVDLIIERMMAGKDLLPQEPIYLAGQAAVWYGMLAEGGTFFAEVPSPLYPYISRWGAHVQRTYGDVLDVQVEKTLCDSHMRLRKLPGAPESLPLLSAKDVMMQRRKMP